MSDHASQPDCSRERIQRLHDWYRANVLDLPLLPEVERRWLAFCRQGFNGQQLARVVRWLRQEIARNRRNPGALKISVLLDWSEDGSLLRFAEDYAAASAAFGGRFNTDRRLEPMPESEGGRPAAAPQHAPVQTPAVPVPKSDPVKAAAALADLKRFRATLQ